METKTNGNKIRNMNNEQLAAFLTPITTRNYDMQDHINRAACSNICSIDHELCVVDTLDESCLYKQKNRMLHWLKIEEW